MNTKNHPNSFRDTGLKAVLDQHGVTEVVVTGAMSHMCVDATTRAACATGDLEFDGVTTPAAQVHSALIAALAFYYGDVISTEAFLAR